MEQNKELMDLLRQIRKSNRIQTTVCCMLCGFALIVSVICVVLFAKIYDMLPRLNEVFDQMETVLVNLEQATEQFAVVDFQAMVEDGDALVATGQESLEQTMEKLNTIDFKTLNQAIKDLAKVIEPLVKVAKVFG